MEKQSTSKALRTSNEPTAASILGIKGQLRFHPHGSTQKPHVVLRQVDISEDTDDEGESSTIYFSLFAQKRIEVKPGKEILLAVAAPDGKLLDTPVIFAGRLRGEDTTPERVIPPPAQADPILPSSPCTLPPKMRKTWSKRTTTQNGECQNFAFDVPSLSDFLPYSSISNYTVKDIHINWDTSSNV